MIYWRIFLASFVSESKFKKKFQIIIVWEKVWDYLSKFSFKKRIGKYSKQQNRGAGVEAAAHHFAFAKK